MKPRIYYFAIYLNHPNNAVIQNLTLISDPNKKLVLWDCFGGFTWSLYL
jgi:hypothetical protein